MSFDMEPDHDIIEHELEIEYKKVMLNNAAARKGYISAKSFGLDQIGCLKSAVISLNVAYAEIEKDAILKAREL